MTTTPLEAWKAELAMLRVHLAAQAPTLNPKKSALITAQIKALEAKINDHESQTLKATAFIKEGRPTLVVLEGGRR